MTIDYYIFGSCEGENYSECFVNFQSQDYQSKWDYELNKKVVIKCETVNYPLTSLFIVLRLLKFTLIKFMFI